MLGSIKAYMIFSLLFLVVGCGFLFSNEFDDELFDSAKWKSYSGNPGESLRYKMLDDLMMNHLPIGISLAESDLLLGNPEYKTQSTGRVTYNYNCGIPKFGFHIDPEVLFLEFENGKLIKKSHFEG